MAALQAREDRARARSVELAGQIEALTGQLSLVEAELSRLQITRETVDEVLSTPVGEQVPPGVVLDVEAAAVPQLAELVPVLLAAEACGDATVTSQAYRRILIVFAE